MTLKHFHRAIIGRLISMVIFSILGSYLLFVKSYVFWSVVTYCIVIGLAISTLLYFNIVNRWIALFLIGIENEDTTLKIPEKSGNRVIDEILQRLQRLNDLFREKRIEIGTQEKYYLTVINQSGTGLFSINSKGRIININPAAEKLTGLIAFHHVNSLSRISSTLPDFILKSQQQNNSSSAIYENYRGQKLLFKVSDIRTSDEVIKLVAVSDITKELDMSEVDAWIKLARTLSHEIMNNIAPITTLSQVTLNYFLKNDKVVEADSIDNEIVYKTIKGLKVIEERSSGLKKFVENYRKFTKLPDPELKTCDLIGLIRKVHLISSGFENYKSVKFTEKLPSECIITTDENLLTQVLLNLLKNALESFRESTNPEEAEIGIMLSQNARQIEIQISNNGDPIPPELREQIFVPFFTSKENGTGIGLSLSKQIMLKLGGDISLGPDKKNLTCFRITIPEII